MARSRPLTMRTPCSWLGGPEWHTRCGAEPFVDAWRLTLFLLSDPLASPLLSRAAADRVSGEPAHHADPRRRASPRPRRAPAPARPPLRCAVTESRVIAAPSPSASPSPLASPSPVAQQTQAPSQSQRQIDFDQYPFAAMIDNIDEARPQFGLDGADVVYEAPAEGGIPRLMPVYLALWCRRAEHRTSSQRARTTSSTWPTNIASPLVHIGASPQGFDALQRDWPARSRRAARRPGLLRAFVPVWRRTTRSSARPRFATCCASAAHRQTHARAAQLRRRTNRHTACRPPSRSLPGRRALQGRIRLRRRPTGLHARHGRPPHQDGATGDQYAAASIVIQYADVEPIPNDDRRTDGRAPRRQRQRHPGRATGRRSALEWSKASLRDATRFTRTDGAPFELPDGQVWIQVVPLETQLSIT